MGVLSVRGLSKTYGTGPDGFAAIADCSLNVERGEMLCIVGPSGCGKTTLLRCLSGLLEPTAGTVELFGQPVVRPPRTMALVFQDYSRSLLPWLDVQANVTMPLKARGLPCAERDALARGALQSVGLAAHAHKYPWQLSGGMQQRTAIARALAYQPEILLMDEPFASVDAQTRAELEDLLLEIWSTYDVTVLLVTHDIDEAVYLADRIVVLSASPSHVQETLTVDLPRPRDQIATKQLPAFAHLRAHDEGSTHGLLDLGGIQGPVAGPASRSAQCVLVVSDRTTERKPRHHLLRCHPDLECRPGRGLLQADESPIERRSRVLVRGAIALELFPHRPHVAQHIRNARDRREVGSGYKCDYDREQADPDDGKGADHRSVLTVWAGTTAPLVIDMCHPPAASVKPTSHAISPSAWTVQRL
jgi:NitT/TauT family transport system ATP-binding protein